MRSHRFGFSRKRSSVALACCSRRVPSTTRSSMATGPLSSFAEAPPSRASAARLHFVPGSTPSFGRQEARLQIQIDESPLSVPWLEVVSSLIQRDFGAAVATLELMGAFSAAAEARVWAGEWLVQQGRHGEANVQLERALAFWRLVGARRYLERSESLLAA